MRSLFRALLPIMLGGVGMSCSASSGDGGGGIDHPPGEIVLKDRGFLSTESVLHDPDTDLYLVSNVNGSRFAKDDNGFISVVTAEGELLELKAIAGGVDSVTLNAPRGMAATGTDLYVTDIDVVRRFDLHSAKPIGLIPVPGATSLDAIVADGSGALYFTDSGYREEGGKVVASGTDAVYRLSGAGKLDTLARGEELGHPTGIALSHDSVWVVSQGTGELYRVEHGARTDVRTFPVGQLYGLVIVNGDAFVSSWESRSIWRGPINGPFRPMLANLDSPAGIGHDAWRNRILIPLFERNEIRIVPLAF